MGAVEIFKGTVGEVEEQPRRKLEQLDAEVEAVVDPVIVNGHMQKLGKKWDKRKAEVDKWVNGGGG